MKRIVFLLFCLVIINLLSSLTKISNSKSNESYCGIEIIEAKTQEVLGKNIGFFVKFLNTTDKSLDAIEYKVIYKDGFNDVKGIKTFRWQTGNLIGPIKPNSVLNDGSTNWISDANKIEVKILRVHFTDDTSCDGKSSIKSL